MDRASITRMVYSRLATERDFRRRLTAAAPDGIHPIIVALPDQPVDYLLRDLASVGGAANVVIPALNGLVVLAMTQDAADDAGVRSAVPRLRSDCTVGVLLTRLHVDLGGSPGEMSYRFVVTGPDSAETPTRAEFVALAG